MTYPSGKMVNYMRDSQGALTQIVYPIGTGTLRYSTNYTYSPSSLLMTGMTIGNFVDPIVDLSFSYTNASGFEKGVYEDVSDNTIRISPQGMAEHTYNWGRGVFPYYGDKLTVYLHAGFHLASSAGSKEPISDSALYAAATPLVRLSVDVMAEQLKSSVIGAAFAMACGPGTTVPPSSKRGY